MGKSKGEEEQSGIDLRGLAVSERKVKQRV